MLSSKFLLLAAIPMFTSCGVVATGMAAGNAFSINEINRRLAFFELLEMETDVGQMMRQGDTETITVGDTVLHNGKARQAHSDSYAVIVPVHKHAGILLQLASTRKSFRLIKEKFSHLMRVAPNTDGRYVFRAPAGAYRLLVVNNRLEKFMSGSRVTKNVSTSHYLGALRTDNAKSPPPTNRNASTPWNQSAEQMTKLYAKLPPLLPPHNKNWQRMK